MCVFLKRDSLVEMGKEKIVDLFLFAQSEGCSIRISKLGELWSMRNACKVGCIFEELIKVFINIILNKMEEVSGFGEPTVQWIGKSAWEEAAAQLVLASD